MAVDGHREQGGSLPHHEDVDAMIDGIGERVFQQHGRILEFMGETDCPED
jgi:hypothetical protein